MSEEKRQRIRDLARESTLIDAIDLAQQICETALAGGDTTDGGGTGPGTTDGGGTGPGTTDGGGTGPGTTDTQPPLPCTEFEGLCEFSHSVDGRLVTFDGECHDCVQSMIIPSEMNYSIVGTGFKLGYVYKMKVLKGTINDVPTLDDGKTIDPVNNEIIDSDDNSQFIKLTPEAGFTTFGGPFGEGLGEYLIDPITEQNDESITVTDFELFVKGFDFSKPDYNISDLTITIDMCPGPNTDDQNAPTQPECLPGFNSQTYPSCTSQNIYRQIYIWHPGLNNYEDLGEDSNAQCFNQIFDKNQWIPMAPAGSEEYQRSFGFDSQEFKLFFADNDVPTWALRLIRECINPSTGTAKIRVITSQLREGQCPVFPVYYNFVAGCVSGDCSIGTIDGLNSGQVPIERLSYDCSDPSLIINNANDTHVEINSLVMNGPLVGNNWFETFLESQNKNKPFISGSYLNSDYIETYPCFASLESEKFSDYLYPTVNGNNNNWTLTDTSPGTTTPATEGYISVQEEGLGGAGQDPELSRVVSFTIHSSSGGPTTAFGIYYTTSYALNTSNLPETGTLYFDLQYIPASDNAVSTETPVGYTITNSYGTRTVAFPTIMSQPYSTSVKVTLSPGDQFKIFVRRYTRVVNILGTPVVVGSDSTSAKITNLIFESSEKRYGQVSSFIVDLDYCNTNQGYDPTWPGTDKGTDFPVENGINGLRIIETMRAETEDPDLVIERGMWIYNHTEEVWVGNPCGKILSDLSLSPNIDLNTLHPYWKMRSKCSLWSEETGCQESEFGNFPEQCANKQRSSTGERDYLYGQYDCTMPQQTTTFDQDTHRYGCKDFDCCCQVCTSNFGVEECCVQQNPFCGWDTFCANVARRFCGNDIYCGDNMFFPASGYGNDYSQGSSQNKETIPCCSESAAFQFGTIDWMSYLNFESYDAKDFVDENGKVSICYVFTTYKNTNSEDDYTLNDEGLATQNSPYKIYIDRLRAIPASSTEYIPPPDQTEGYSGALIVLPPWLTDITSGGEGGGEEGGGGGETGGGGPTGPS